MFAQKKTNSEVEQWNKLWEQASNKWSKLATRGKNIVSVAKGLSSRDKFPSISGSSDAELKDILCQLLKNYNVTIEDDYSYNKIVELYEDEIEDAISFDKDTQDVFGYVNTWWVFNEVASQLDYEIFMAEASNIGYKRTKRGEKPMPNELYRTNNLRNTILFDDGIKESILDTMRDIEWN